MMTTSIASTNVDNSGPLKVVYLILFFILFCANTLGWLLIFSFSAWFPPNIVWLPPILISILSISMVIVVGREHASPDASIVFRVICMVMLLLISGVGTLNSLFYLIEGRDILIETSDQVKDGLGKLQVEASKVLVTPKYDRKVMVVQGLLKALDAEIRNSVNCGEGEAARRIINKITIELPTFVVLSGSMQDCNGVDERVVEYNKMGQDTLAEYRKSSDEFVEQKRATLALIDMRTKETINRLNAAVQESTAGNYGTIINAIESAASTYQQLYLEVRKNGIKLTLESKLSIERIRQIGSMSQLPQLVLDRFDHFSTKLYVLFSLGFDVFVVAIYSHFVAIKLKIAGAMIEARKTETARLKMEELEAERIEEERIEVARIKAKKRELERIEEEKREAEMLEAARISAEKLETKRLEAKRLEVERLEAARIKAEILESERVEAERVAVEKAEADILALARKPAFLWGE